MSLAAGPHVNREHAAPAPGKKRATLGAHVRAAVATARAAGFAVGAAAVFVSAPRAARLTLTPEEAAELRGGAARELALYAHSSYAAAPWGPGAAERAAFVREEAALAGAAGCAGLVVHLPRGGGGGQLGATAREALALLGPPGGGSAPVFFETPAFTPPHAAFVTPGELGALAAALAAGGAPPGSFGLAVDTAHLHTAGVDLRTAGRARAWLAELRGGLPPGVPLLFHLNDSCRPLGVGPDKHAALTGGHVWAGAPLEASGLAAFVAFARDEGVPCILERSAPELLAVDYRVLRALAPERAV